MGRGLRKKFPRFRVLSGDQEMEMMGFDSRDGAARRQRSDGESSVRKERFSLHQHDGWEDRHIQQEHTLA